MYLLSNVLHWLPVVYNVLHWLPVVYNIIRWLPVVKCSALVTCCL